MATDPELAILVQQLSRYLRKHPHACDTQDAIARWWLGPEVLREPALLETALRWLERQGVIEPLRATDGRVRYRRSDTGPESDARLDELMRDAGPASDPSRGSH